MVNRIDNNRQLNNPYTSSIKNVNSKNIEEFPSYLLGDDEGVIWDRDEDNAKKNKRTDSKQRDVYERSAESKSIEAASKDADLELKKESEQPYTPPRATLSGVISQIFGGFRKLFEFIWYGEGGKEAAINNKAEAVELEKSDAEGTKLDQDESGKNITGSVNLVATDDTRLTINGQSQLADQSLRLLRLPRNRDEKPDSYIKNEQRLKEVTEGKLARNTSLLTYYDRHGNLVSPSVSEYSRILHGDRNVRTF